MKFIPQNLYICQGSRYFPSGGLLYFPRPTGEGIDGIRLIFLHYDPPPRLDEKLWPPRFTLLFTQNHPGFRQLAGR